MFATKEMLSPGGFVFSILTSLLIIWEGSSKNIYRSSAMHFPLKKNADEAYYFVLLKITLSTSSRSNLSTDHISLRIHFW